MMKGAALAMIRFYQRAVSPSLPPTCRFEPSCSHYSYEAIEKHGLAGGSWLTVRRVVRCHPFQSRSYDPVP